MEDAEREVKKMAAVVGTGLPDDTWRLRPITTALSSGKIWVASLIIERFCGVIWMTYTPVVVGGQASTRDESWEMLLSAWGEKTEWTVDLGPGLKPLRIPPASSVEELCLKLDLTGEDGQTA